MSHRILLVEDNPIDAREISCSLEQSGFLVDTVPTAEAGLLRLQSERFDLLLCDLNLPGDNGIQLCRRVKASSDVEWIPVVLLTRYSEPLNLLRGLEAGADGFFSKGQTSDTLVQRLRRVIARYETEGDRPQPLAFLDTEIPITSERTQLLEVLLEGFEDAVHVNEKYEEAVRARALAQKSLRDANALYSSLVETLPLGVTRKDRDGRYLFANRHFCESLGRSVGSVVGRTDFELFPRETAASLQQEDRRVCEAGETVDSVVTGDGGPDGKTSVRMRKVPVYNAREEITGVQSICWDITELMQTEEQLRAVNASLETRVAQRTAELQEHVARLQQKNTELDQFVYVTSHDLQEPLRKLISFSQLLEADLGDDLNAKAQQDLHYIADSARRMKQLIQDLLTLSRAGRSALNRRELRLDACVDRALDVLSMRIEESQAEIIRPLLPTVLGDETTLTLLFQNLISNALKFRSHPRPVIELTVRQTDGCWVLGVRDDGIGIAPQHFDQIFAPFQRLHAREKYDGTGMGLAICRTTVERHGGTIWVESEPGGGAHFQFTLPLHVSSSDDRRFAPVPLLSTT